MSFRSDRGGQTSDPLRRFPDQRNSVRSFSAPDRARLAIEWNGDEPPQSTRRCRCDNFSRWIVGSPEDCAQGAAGVGAERYGFCLDNRIGAMNGRGADKAVSAKEVQG